MLCKHSSEMERVAAEAERASIKYKQVEYMSDKIGQTFKGTISGVTEWGIFVEITENKCEGLVRAREMNDDSYTFDEDNYRYVGRNKGKIYSHLLLPHLNPQNQNPIVSLISLLFLQL